MKSYWRIALVLLTAAAIPILSVRVQAAKEQIELDDAQIFFEENATDGDLGLQFFFDGEGWQSISILDANGKKMVNIKVGGSAKLIGLTEVFSESSEPSFDELPRDEFLALFPPGEYTIIGKTVEGATLVGEATLTHDLPAAPVITAPAAGAEVDPDDPLVVTWNLTPNPNPPGSVIEAYQVIVEKDEEDERLRVFSVDMASTDTSVTVPAEFFEPGKNYKVELIAVETSGNKTISERTFSTEAP